MEKKAQTCLHLVVVLFSLNKNQALAYLSITDESTGAVKTETISSTRSESVAIKRKNRNGEESTEDDCISSEDYGNEHGERRVKQSTEKHLKAKVSSKMISNEQKLSKKTGFTF